MLRCVAVDDEAAGLQVLETYINQTPDLELQSMFSDPVEALAAINQSTPDVAFLDIDMPGLDGLALSRLMNDHHCAIVFCTAYPQYAPDSYELGAVDYLLKPFSYERFLKAVERIRSRARMTDKQENQEQRETLFIKSGSKIHQVSIADIHYLKKDGHYMLIHTKQGQLVSRMSMDEILAVLPMESFQRVHKSWVVSIDKISLIERHHLVILGEEIPIGSTYRNALLERIDHTGS